MMNVEWVTVATHESRPLDVAWELSSNDAVVSAQWEALGSLRRETIGNARCGRCTRRGGLLDPGTPGSARPLLCQHDWVHVLRTMARRWSPRLEVSGSPRRANDDMHACSLTGHG